MGLFDRLKKSLGLGGEGPSLPTAAAAPRAAQTPSGIAGWPGPETRDREAAMEAHKLMSWVTHEDFSLDVWRAEPFQTALGVLEASEARADMIEILKRASLRVEDHPPLLRQLALLYTDQHDNASARAIWSRLVDMRAWLPEATHHLGQLAEREGMPVEASAWYQRAIVYDASVERSWQRAEALKAHIPMPRKAAAATLGGAEAGAHLEGLGVRAPEGYSLLHPLGRGGYGTVYLARDTHLRRDVAIKFLHPHLTREERRVAAFFEEARLVARLATPGVVRIYDLDREARVIVMEYLTRGTLRDRLSSGRALAPRAALRVAISLLRTLGRLHDEGVVHRDLKPANILFRADGSAVLGDFGVAALEDNTGGSRGAGTLAYMAPEQKDPSVGDPPDRRADLYAMGLILTEMLAGGLPVGASRGVLDPSVFVAILPASVRDLVAPALRSLLAPKPDDRPDAAATVVGQLRALSRQIAAQAQTPELVAELEKLIADTAPDDGETRARLQAMRRALER